MPDLRDPVDFADPGTGRPGIRVRMLWNGRKGTVMTGDTSQFGLEVVNLNAEAGAVGAFVLQVVFSSPFRELVAAPPRTVPFSVPAGAKVTFTVPSEWLHVEGKLAYLASSYILNGSAGRTNNDPLASVTVVERSTYTSQSRKDTATLLIALVAAVSSIIAAVFSGWVLLR